MKLDIFKGALWTFSVRLVDRGLGLISTLFLARILVPADFGLIAMATSVTAVIELVTAFGFELTLVQRPKPSRADYDTAWTLNLIVAACGAAVITLLAQPAAVLYEEPRLVGVMFVLAGSMLIGGIENIGTVDFRRNMDFRGEFRFMTGRRVAAFLATILTALIAHSYWALLVGIVTGRLVGVILSYSMQAYRPRLSLESSAALLRFSRWTLVSSALIAGIQRLPHFAIGKISGPQDLGLYVMAMELGTMPTTELSAPVNRSAMAGYARLVGSPQAFRTAFLDVGAMVAAVALPAGVGLAVFAEPLILLVLGAKWLGALPILQVVAFSGIWVALGSNNGVACIASGKPHLNTWMQAIRLFTLMILMAVLAPRAGTLGVAWAELVSALVGYLLSCWLGLRCVGVRAFDFLARMWRPALATVLVAMIVREAFSIWGPIEHAGGAFRLLALLGPLAAAGYCGIMMLLWVLCGRPPGTEAQLQRVVRSFLAQRLRLRAVPRP